MIFMATERNFALTPEGTAIARRHFSFAVERMERSSPIVPARPRHFFQTHRSAKNRRIPAHAFALCVCFSYPQGLTDEA
jgi:hypothetical protein